MTTIFTILRVIVYSLVAVTFIQWHAKTAILTHAQDQVQNKVAMQVPIFTVQQKEELQKQFAKLQKDIVALSVQKKDPTNEYRTYALHVITAAKSLLTLMAMFAIGRFAYDKAYWTYDKAYWGYQTLEEYKILSLAWLAIRKSCLITFSTISMSFDGLITLFGFLPESVGVYVLPA